MTPSIPNISKPCDQITVYQILCNLSASFMALPKSLNGAQLHNSPSTRETNTCVVQPWCCTALELRKACVFLKCHVGGLSICRCICDSWSWSSSSSSSSSSPSPSPSPSSSSSSSSSLSSSSSPSSSSSSCPSSSSSYSSPSSSSSSSSPSPSSSSNSSSSSYSSSSCHRQHP